MTSRQGSHEFVFVSSSGTKVVLSRCRERGKGGKEAERDRERRRKGGKKEKVIVGELPPSPNWCPEGAVSCQWRCSVPTDPRRGRRVEVLAQDWCR